MRIAKSAMALLFLVSFAGNSVAQGFGKVVDDGAAGYASELARFHGSSVSNLLKKNDFEPFAVSFFGWRALTITRLPYNKLEGTHLNICRLALGIYDKELDATLQTASARPTAMIAFVEATPAEKEAIQKFVVRKYGAKYMTGLSAISASGGAAAPPKKDETAAWKYELGAALGELAGSVVKWFAFPSNPKYDESISDMLRNLDKVIRQAPKDTPPDLLNSLRQLNALGSKRYFPPDDRLQIGVVIKQTLMTTMAFAKPLSPALEAIAAAAEQAKPQAKPAPAEPAKPAPAKAPSASEVAGQYLQEGLKKYQAQMYDPAIDDFNRAVDLDPNKPSAYFHRGRAFIQKGLYDRAIADFTKAIYCGGVNADDFFYLDYRALALIRKGDMDSALDDLNQAIAFNPNNDYGFYLRGAVYRSKGNIAQARADFQTVLKLKPSSKEAQDALAALNK